LSNKDWGSEVGELVTNLQSLFSNLSETPTLDTQVLLAHITGKNRAWLLAHPEAVLPHTQQTELEIAVTRLQAGEPLPYVLGNWDFYGLNFNINAHTLIPRPETELLVEQGLQWLQSHPAQRHIADIGTGSGCIAIALAVNIPDLRVIATDVSAEALEIAQTNAKKHAVDNQIDFLQTDLLSLPASCLPLHVICANLPYIPTETLAGLEVFKREPTLALDGGPDGLSLIRRLLPQAVHHLASGGLLLLEIEHTQSQAALNLAQEFFSAAQIDLLPDLADHDRVIRIETFTE
jgi:release factor glutamine methyltransferase